MKLQYTWLFSLVAFVYINLSIPVFHNGYLLLDFCPSIHCFSQERLVFGMKLVFLNILRISASNVLKIILNIIVSIDVYS